MRSSHVIAISGSSGAGKTSLVKAVAAGFGDAAMLFFDDFGSEVAPDPATWATAKGADFSRVTSPEFADALATLRAGASITLPDLSDSVGRDRSSEVRPARVIVVEEPYGRLRPESARSIDFVVFISTPLHVALARRLSRQLRWHEEWARSSEDAGEAVARLREFTSSATAYLDSYVAWEHTAVLEQERQLRETSDLVVDGLRPVEELASEVVAAAKERAGP